jgi:putative transposase
MILSCPAARLKFLEPLKSSPMLSNQITRVNSLLEGRRTIRFKGHDYSSEGTYFITICVRNRECLLGYVEDGAMVLNDTGKIVKTVWNEMPKFYAGVETDVFQIMPNHVHGIIVIHPVIRPVGAIHESPLQKIDANPLTGRRQMTIPKIVGRFKMNAAKQINLMRSATGVPVWQRNYYEHIIRGEDSLDRIRKYILDNPMQWETDDLNPINNQQTANKIW